MLLQRSGCRRDPREVRKKCQPCTRSGLGLSWRAGGLTQPSQSRAPAPLKSRVLASAVPSQASQTHITPDARSHRRFAGPTSSQTPSGRRARPLWTEARPLPRLHTLLLHHSDGVGTFEEREQFVGSALHLRLCTDRGNERDVGLISSGSGPTSSTPGVVRIW